MDEIDKYILNLLQEDSKITNLQLSKEINLSPASTLERVRKLEAKEIIQKYTVKVNEDKLNFQYSFFVYVKLNLSSETILTSFIDSIQEIPEVVEAYQITGKTNFLLRIITRDAEEYTKVLLEKLSILKGVDSIYGDLVLKKIKDFNLNIK